MERQQRKLQIEKLKYERVVNDGLMRRISALLDALKSHAAEAESRNPGEEARKITSESMHTGFDSSHVNKTKGPSDDNKVELLNPNYKAPKAEDVRTTASLGGGGGGDDDDDDDEAEVEASAAAKEFGRIP